MKQRAITLLLLSFLGLVDTLYLGIKRGTPVPCSITTGCEEVLNSRFSTLAGFVISIGLVAVQAFILRAYCQYCLVSAILTTLIFCVSPRPVLRRMAQET